ncbi:MAG: hypothetical protein ACOC2M_03105 [bacterium]
MSLDFFQNNCKESPRNDEIFGLCDAQDGTKAYSDTENSDDWIATVKNEKRRSVTFTAIDKCVLLDDEFPGKGRCDGMLTSSELLYLVELKNQEPPWQPDAIEQLESTIELLKANHDISTFKKRKAYACNKKRNAFVVLDNEFNKKFMRRTSFRIDIQAEIVVV